MARPVLLAALCSVLLVSSSKISARVIECEWLKGQFKQIESLTEKQVDARWAMALANLGFTDIQVAATRDMAHQIVPDHDAKWYWDLTTGRSNIELAVKLGVSCIR
jgi:hypothetical protein